MQDNLQTSILTDCIDQMAIIPYLATFGERYHFTQELTEILTNYPQPSDHNNKRQCLAYRFVGRALKTLDLAQTGKMHISGAFMAVSGYVEIALGLLTHDKE